MDERSENSPDEGEEGEDGSRKISNRACDFCHRMKMKCIGKEDPPCNRCRSAGHACTFDGPRKSKTSKVEDRLRLVESQMGGMQSALEELLHLQRAAVAPPPNVLHPSQRYSMGDAYPPPNPYRPTPPPHMLTLDSFLTSSGTPGSHHQSLHPLPIDPTLTSPPNRGPLSTSASSSQPLALPPPRNLQPTPTPSQPSHARQPAPARSTAPAANDDEDPDQPLGPWDNMYYLAEAARLTADGQPVKTLSPSTSPVAFRQLDGSGAPAAGRKRKRSEAVKGKGNGAAKVDKVWTRDELLEVKKGLPVMRNRQVDLEMEEAAQDAIGLGLCTLEEGRELFETFMENSSRFMPCFDPDVDTFDSMRSRSALCTTTLIHVASKIRDAGRAPSELQRRSREHAEKIAMSTLFSPLAKLEVVQAMIVLSSWGDTSWRPGGHALRMAMDMGLYRCLPLLSQSGMGKGKTAEELRDEWTLVVGARCWMTLCKMDHEMAINYNRPSITYAEQTLKYSREFLQHPLASVIDSRLVATNELLGYKLVLHQPFSTIPDHPGFSSAELEEKIRKCDENAEEWMVYWDGYHESRGIPKGHFLRETLITQKGASSMYTNSKLLHGVRSKRDVGALSAAQRDRLLKAVNGAETLLGMALRSQQYRSTFKWANLYTHINWAYAARFLIRMASLLPDKVNLRQIGRDIQQVSMLLTQVPGFQFGHLLSEILSRARRQNVLPPATRPPSPSRPPSTSLPTTNANHPTPLSSHTATLAGSTPGGVAEFNFTLDSTTPTSGTGGGDGFDFQFAEMLFNEPRAGGSASAGAPGIAGAAGMLGAGLGGGMGLSGLGAGSMGFASGMGGGNGSVGGSMFNYDTPVMDTAGLGIESNFNLNLDQWFPFPPLLDTDTTGYGPSGSSPSTGLGIAPTATGHSSNGFGSSQAGGGGGAHLSSEQGGGGGQGGGGDGDRRWW